MQLEAEETEFLLPFNESRKAPYFGIFMGALLLGFAWQIRGMGTSDPSVVAFLFLMYLSVWLGPRGKFNLPVFGLIAFAIVVMRTGWGTFVSQAGIPGALPGYLPPKMDIAVPWWRGYFWLFIVGISWMGIPAVLFGGYLFTRQRYTLKDAGILLGVFAITIFAAGYLAEWLIPRLAPEYYEQIYLSGISARSYGSMRGNLSTALAIIPVLLYVGYVKKDRMFFKNSLVAMGIFAFSLAIADVWHPLSVLMDKLTPGGGWGLWEYSTGFLFGLFIFLYFSTFSKKDLAQTDLMPEWTVAIRKPTWKFIVNGVGLYFFVLYGIAESLEGGIRKSLYALGIDYSPNNLTLKLGIGLVGILLYGFYFKGKIGGNFAKRPFTEKSLLLLLLLLPFHYFNFSVNRILSGDIFLLDWKNIVVWLDTVSFAAVEIYLAVLYRSRDWHALRVR